MKILRTIHRTLPKAVIPVIILVAAALFVFANKAVTPVPAEQRIEIALLLDTSNSMDGLIEQAKSQLWKIVNEMSVARCSDGSRPKIKIALYEYGNDGLSMHEGYIRQVSGLTDNLDLISEKLFSLRTNGGAEFCGQVIKTSLNQLAWSASPEDLKMIFIAGNEPFTQGPVSYDQACALAKEKNVVVNTIFCGAFEEGLHTQWKRGADLAGGTYMSIEQDRKTVYVATPYDDRIEALNDRLNATYVYYGTSGYSSKKNQVTQDDNASSYSKENKVERTISKSSHAYRNKDWDLVDAYKDDEKAVSNVKDSELPEEMKGMTIEQRKVYVKQKTEDRKKIQDEIQTLSKQRQEYIAKNKPAGSEAQQLDAAMITAIRKQAASKKLQWK